MSSEASSGGSINRLGRPPGAGVGRGRLTFPGRNSSSRDLADVRRIIGATATEPTLLVEYLHLIQDAESRVRHGHLAALAECLNLSLGEVYEVATFYHRFEVVGDDAPAAVPTVHICDGLPCQMAGADALAAEAEGKCRVIRSACMGRCDCAPVAAMGSRYLGQADNPTIEALLAAPEDAQKVEPGIDFENYQSDGGYTLLRQCLAGDRRQPEIIAILEQSGLRGLGGAGFPTGRKWALVAAEPGPRFLAVNGDESEPGTFKDRHYLESDPHRFIEGMLLAAWAVDAAETYIYLRDEYAHLRHLLQRQLAKVTAAGLCHGTVHLRRGAGAYICGEESAMLESIEGKRGLPRHRPPFPAQRGLFGRPTLIHNVETLYWIREIVESGGRGLRAYSVSGRVREPGVKFAPAGITVRQLIDEHCGGMAEGQVFKAYLPGGASGGILPASKADLPLDFGGLDDEGCFVGSAAIVIMGEGDSIADAARNLMRFFADESCGQCTPCRVGTEKAVALMERPDWDAELLEELCGVMAEASICGLGNAAPNPLRCALKFFPDEVLP